MQRSIGRGPAGPSRRTNTSSTTASPPEAAATPDRQQPAAAGTDSSPGLEAEFMTQVRELFPWTIALSDAELAAVAKHVARTLSQTEPQHPSTRALRNLT